MNIRKIMLLEIKKGLSFKDRIFLHIFKRYSMRIYQNGFDDGYYYNEKKNL